MQVLCIVHREDCDTGDVSAVIEMPEGADKDTIFVAWLKACSKYWQNKSDQECLNEAEYVWHINEVDRSYCQ